MALKFVSLLLLVAWSSSTPLDFPPLDSPPVEPAVALSTRATDAEYRLPEGAVEVQLYDIELRLDDATFLTTYKYEGHTIISFRTLVATNQIKIHADVAITERPVLTTSAGVEISLTNTDFNRDNDTHILTLTTGTQIGRETDLILTFHFTGDLRTDSLSGFYKSTYIDENNNEVTLGTTQFQPTHARKAFPCFDEPAYKAEFDIKIRHPTRLTAISNTEGTPVEDEDDPNFTTTTFLRTPRMPTYLIAFVVSDFSCSRSDQYIDGDIPHYICSRREEEPIRELAKENGPVLVKALEEFTGVTYETSTLTKLHQFAIPDFSAGAMENWGLITYRETYMLWDPEHSSNRYKQALITVVAHELAHFWFGNLVTTHWWDTTFLNEGFATYFEYHIAHEVHPDFELDKQFVIEQLQPVMVSDASPGSAPLDSPASTPSQISNRFSSISYNKGGSVIRMVQHFLGLDNFKAGLNKYLTDNQFKNTQPANLWAAMQNSVPANALPAGLTLAGTMENWVTKPGYPVVNVTIQDGAVRLEQKRFLSSGEPQAGETWYIPITYTTSSDSNKFRDTSTKLWLGSAAITVTNALQNESDWIVLNNQQIGYYRVDYQDQLWEKIRLALNKPGFDGIHEINRAQIIDDYYIFARYGRKSWNSLLELLTFLRKDTSYYSWYAANNAFSYMTQRVGNEQLRQALSAYILELVEVLYSSLPFNEIKDDDQIFSYKKILVIPWVCRLGLQDCVDHAVAAFAAYKQTGIAPQKNLRATIYCNALRHSTDPQGDYTFLWNKFLVSKLATETSTILSALGCATNVDVLNDYLRKSIDPNSGIRRQDASSVFSSVYTNNPEGVDVAFDFLVANYQDVVTFYNSMNSLANLFSGLAGRFTRKEQTDKFAEFIESGVLGDAEPYARSALNSALTNLDFIAEFENDLNLFFTVPEDDGSSASTVSAGLTLMTTLMVFFYQILN